MRGVCLAPWLLPVLLACGDRTSTGAGGSGGRSATTSTTLFDPISTSSGESCRGDGCPDGWFCDVEYDQCEAGAKGFCTPAPEDCSDAPLALTCGCDGIVRDSPCLVHADGSDVSHAEICPAPAGTFPCGSTFCVLGSEYCAVDEAEVMGYILAESCHSLPAACTHVGAGCSCLSDKPCAESCQHGPDGSFRITCYYCLICQLPPRPASSG